MGRQVVPDTRRDRGEALAAELDAAVAAGRLSAAVGLVGNAERVLWTHAAGDAQEQPLARFDLASLTKPFTATLALALARRGALKLEGRLGDLAENVAPALARRSLASLLRHRSGLQAWVPLYALCQDRAEARTRLLGGEWLGAAPGTYSDCGYALWGFLAEVALDTALPALLAREVLRPMGMESVAAQPGSLPDVLPCRLNTDREVELARRLGRELAPLGPPGLGEAQDGNARRLGPLLGSAGLFGNAEDLWRLGCEWLRPDRLLDGEAVAAALRGRGERALGWWRRRRRGAAGPALSPAAFGHTGFTGGSLWIEPARGLVLVFLAHRTSVDVELASWRRNLHRLAIASWGT